MKEHYGLKLKGMIVLTGLPPSKIAKEIKISKQALYRSFKKKHISTALLHKVAGACKRQVKITLK